MSNEHEHDHQLPILGDAERELSRRSFLKLAGFSTAGIAVAGGFAGCTKPTPERAIPFLIRPEEVTPGVPYYFASTCSGCNAACGIVAKNRDGRPIKLEGNERHPMSRGGLCAVGQASLLGLYDTQRANGPQSGTAAIAWKQADTEITAQLNDIRATGKAVRYLSGTITSPTERDAIERFLAPFPDARHVQYDAISHAATLDAFALTHGARLLPHYRLERATTIVGIDADFLGTWISPVEFTKGYRAARALSAGTGFAHHMQFEARMSVTGSNADERIAASPAECAAIVERLAALIAERAGQPLAVGSAALAPALEAHVQQAAERLWQAKAGGLVLCGINDLRTQTLAATIHHHIGAYGSTVDVQHPSRQYAGDDVALAGLLAELRAGTVAALFVHGANPVYDLPNGTELAAWLAKVPLVVNFGERADETSACGGFLCPAPHPLESWGDAEAIAGTVSLRQPLVQSLRKARPVIESLAIWSGAPATAYDIVRRYWERAVFPHAAAAMGFEAFWAKSLEDGVVTLAQPGEAANTGADLFTMPAIPAVAFGARSAASTGLELALHASHTMLDGRHAHNAWLHELPDPITKIVWDNHASIAPATAERLGLAEGDVVGLRVPGIRNTIELPVHIQPGQHGATVSVALGYGRAGTQRFATAGPDWLQARATVAEGELVGRNASALAALAGQYRALQGHTVQLVPLGTTRDLARSQEFDSLTIPDLLGGSTGEERELIQHITLAAYRANPAAGSFPKPELASMWPNEHVYNGHHWGMVIDLAACTGCSACVVACQVENNIPVVGKDEVRRNREMHWLRIDRYYNETGPDVTVLHQPMMCQHCGNAPCETVCPVIATAHDSEGLNQQAYNRCVGTRYCSNNCPYKVRHFNWFNYKRGGELERMLLNPDVTVRERGVMEKCSMCVQRIQAAKLDARRRGAAFADGDAKTACQQSCPADAITFGDMNDRTSKLYTAMRDARYFRVLEETGVRPSVGYLTAVHDRTTTPEGAGHAGLEHPMNQPTPGGTDNG